MTDNIEERTLEDLVKKGTVKDVAKKLQTAPVILDDENYHDYSLLMTALSNKNLKVAKFLVEKNFRVYKKSKPQAEKTPLHYALEFADFQLIRTVLAKGANPDITALDENGTAPLHTAIKRSENKTLKMLLNPVEISVLDDMLLLHQSIQSHNIQLLKLLLKKGLSPLQKNMRGETAFCIAVKEDDPDALHLLWESHQSIMEYDSDNLTLLGLLIVAIVMDNMDGFIDILDMGITVNAKLLPCPDGWSLFEHFAGYTLLHCAVKYTHAEIVNVILENDGEVMCQDAAGSTPFHIALEVKEESRESNVQRYKMNEEIIDLLVSATHQCQFANPVNKHGISHFHLACTRNRTSWVRHFLHHKTPVDDCVSLESPVFKGFSPLHFAVKYAGKRTVEVLLNAGADIQREAYGRVTPLHVAAKESGIEVARLLIKHGADITRQDYDGNTPVHYAFAVNNYEVVEFLLSVHAIISANPVNAYGMSHFHMACTRSDVGIVAGFLRNGAAVNGSVPVNPNVKYASHNEAMDWRGCSPLHFAAAFSRTEVVQFLLDQNADLDARDARGFTPFHLACQHTCEKFGELIADSLNEDIREEEEADWDRGLFEDSFVDVAAMENEFRACRPYDYPELCEDDEAIVDWSANRKDHVSTVELLIGSECEVNALDDFGNGALFYACYFNLRRILNALAGALNCKSVVRMLLAKSFLKEMVYRRQIVLNCIFKNRNVDVERCYENGSILHYVAVVREYSDARRLDTMEYFLTLGADVDATDEKMQTPLHLATQAKDVLSVKILLEYNANVDCVESRNSATPLHIAANSLCQESVEIVELLMMKRADVNARQSDGRTPLHNLLAKPRDYCAEFRPIFRAFLALRVDVNAQDNRGTTPLFMACTIINCDVVKDLLKYGADVALEDSNGENIYRFVYAQIKSVMRAYQKLQHEAFEIFCVLMQHAVKLETVGLLALGKIRQIWQDLKELVEPMSTVRQERDLEKLVAECRGEMMILQNTKIHNNITLHHLLFYEDHEMTKYFDNDALTAILKSNSFSETYGCYGYLLVLKSSRGYERSQLLPAAKQCLAQLTGVRLDADWFSENILRHLNNVEIRGFIRAASLIKSEEKTSIVPTPLKVGKDHTKYSRIA